MHVQLTVEVVPCRVDCVGILKLRNADVEARIGVAGSKKKSTRARLVFRVNIPGPDGSLLTLQTPSSPILCSESLLFCFFLLCLNSSTNLTDLLLVVST